MDNVWINLNDVTIKVNILKTFFISIYTYYTYLKIINNKKISNIKSILLYICIFIISIIVTIIKYKINFYSYLLCLCVFLSCICSIVTKKNIGYSIVITTISLSFNYILLVVAVVLLFIPNIILKIENDVINFVLIETIHMFILYNIFKINKFKYGISFLQTNSNNEYFDILILNISISILFFSIILYNRELMLSRDLFIKFIIFSFIMFTTIPKFLKLYYKQKLLEQDLKETKEELEKKKEEIKQLEEENLNFSKTSHSLAHKQKSLEYKLEQLEQKYEIAEEIEIKDRIKAISKELYNKTQEMELPKTEIPEIDDMLKYMQSECIKNNIQFQLQIKGNIYEMINNYVSKEDLSILIADHIKNAIIAINYSENTNKTILVRLGKIDKIFSLHIYDSGIEFKKETLLNLGKKPSTTHADNGGTGMGFMNTFDTLKKYNASLIINEYNKPSKDNYTKSIIIRFDKSKRFIINSYKKEINKDIEII